MPSKYNEVNGSSAVTQIQLQINALSSQMRLIFRLRENISIKKSELRTL